MGVFQELKRRNVFRVGVAYILAAWVLLQIVDFVLEVIAAPDWILQVFVLAAAVGLPVALVFSWVFEMTPQGLKREKQIDRSQSITPQTGRKLDRVIIATLAVAVVFLLVDKFLLAPGTRSGTVATDPAAQTVSAQPAAQTVPAISVRSIAVLPFVVLSNGLDDEYFADGLTEEILNSLAQLPELLVTARTSAFSFKGQDVPVQEIAEKLGVRHIVEGSVRRSGERLRVTAQLIRAEDGFHLWSENYDSTSVDTIAVQEDIAEKIAVAMDVVMDEEKRERMRRAGLRDVEAFIDMQKGREWYARAHGDIDQMEGLREANHLFESVLEKVPGYPPALQLHSDLYVHILLSDSTGQPMTNVTEQDIATAPARAIADYTEAIAHARSTSERYNLELDLAFITGNWRGMPARIERFLAESGCKESSWVDPIGAVMGYGGPMAVRMHEARLCNPLNSTVWVSEARVTMWSDDSAKALAVASEGVAAVPAAWLHLALVMAQVAAGQFDQADAEIESSFQVDAYAHIARMAVASARGDRQLAEERHEQLLAGTNENGFWHRLAVAWKGDRTEANRLAAETDRHVFGPAALTLLSYWCACGAPWDLSATPNFAAALEESGLPWPPASPINFPLKDW